MSIAKLTRLAEEVAMAIPVTTDAIYMGRPKWSVAHHLSAAGLPSPSKAAPFHQLGLHHKRNVIAASIVFGLLLAAICFAIVQVAHHATRTLQDTARPWADAAVNAKEHTPMPNSAPQSAAPATTPSVSSTATSKTSVTINGEPVPVPDDGTIHREYIDGNSRSTVDIKVHRSVGP